jgi:hypothetical protein
MYEAIPYRFNGVRACGTDAGVACGHRLRLARRLRLVQQQRIQFGQQWRLLSARA